MDTTDKYFKPAFEDLWPGAEFKILQTLKLGNKDSFGTGHINCKFSFDMIEMMFKEAYRHGRNSYEIPDNWRIAYLDDEQIQRAGWHPIDQPPFDYNMFNPNIKLRWYTFKSKQSIFLSFVEEKRTSGIFEYLTGSGLNIQSMIFSGVIRDINRLELVMKMLELMPEENKRIEEQWQSF